MRSGCSIIGLLSLVLGCASSHAPATQPQAQVIDEGSVQLARASALVFTPPITQNQPELDLSRTGREPAAFVSYDQTFTTFYSVRYQDRNFLDSGSFRWAFSQTVGISRR